MLAVKSSCALALCRYSRARRAWLVAHRVRSGRRWRRADHIRALRGAFRKDLDAVTRLLGPVEGPASWGGRGRPSSAPSGRSANRSTPVEPRRPPHGAAVAAALVAAAAEARTAEAVEAEARGDDDVEGFRVFGFDGARLDDAAVAVFSATRGRRIAGDAAALARLPSRVSAASKRLDLSASTFARRFAAASKGASKGTVAPVCNLAGRRGAAHMEVGQLADVFGRYAIVKHRGGGPAMAGVGRGCILARNQDVVALAAVLVSAHQCCVPSRV